MARPSYLIQESPHIALQLAGGDKIHSADIVGIEFGIGALAVSSESSTGLTSRQSLCLALGSVGLENSEIAHLVWLAEGTVKHHMKETFMRLGTRSREALSRRALELGIFTITKRAEPLHLTKREKSIVDLVSLGKSNLEIGQELDIASQTVKSNLANISYKSGLSRRAAIATAALMSGESGDFAHRLPPVSYRYQASDPYPTDYRELALQSLISNV